VQSLFALRWMWAELTSTPHIPRHPNGALAAERFSR